jgi:hypothetical protein
MNKRSLLNEGELVAHLAALPNVTVKQVTFGLFCLCATTCVCRPPKPLQVEFAHLSLADTVSLLETVDVFIGYHGAAFQNVPFLPRGAYVFEILPQHSTHEPLYASRATTTGKFFVRCVCAACLS